MNRAVSGRWWLLALGGFLLAAFAFVVARSGPLAAVQVTIVEVTRGTVSPALFGIGTVEARRAYLIGPTTPGRVLRVLADVGEEVRAGQVLAEMDPVDLEQRLSAQEAAIAAARSAVTRAEAQQRDAEARGQVAAINARRYVALGEQKFVSASAVETRVQEQSSALASTAAARASAAAANQELMRLKAERQALLQQGESLRLRAPHDGIVSARDAEAGSTVVAGQAVLRLLDPSSLWVKVRLDQGRSSGLATGLAAEVVLRSRPGQAIAGRVARVELLGDSVTEERIAQVAFDTLPARLSVGELAEVTLGLPEPAASLVLPNAAIKRRAGRTGVWLSVDGGLRFAEIETGAMGLDGTVQVLRGLAEGDAVVVHSERELSEKTRAKVVERLAGVAR
ncbi:MAG: efflux RND transporter periplasmic adaptor subunit [Rhodocyclaceae bacterium]|nr:efflux RND transporter periplasmic adaptor subunit [Rhodocyclaceae bacterium]